MMRSARRLLPSARRALSTQRYPEVETLAALGEKNLDAYADANALAVKGADGVWNWSTYGELGARARAARGARSASRRATTSRSSRRTAPSGRSARTRRT